MINGNLEQFLDTGWYSEASLFLNGYVYWCEAQLDQASGVTTFFVDRWAAENEGDSCYHSILSADGTLKWTRVLEISDTDLDRIKEKFLAADISDGKSFWQVEGKLAWLDEGKPAVRGA